MPEKKFLSFVKVFFYLSIFSIAGCASIKDAGLFATSSPIKSPNDHREYQGFILPNRLQVLIISDPKADKAAASLDIKVGSGSDPENREGMAHFLEHMLFLGTEKYPEPGEYRRFISSHGGSNNAYTSLEHTNYFFDVHPQYLEPSLDRFAQFFVSPLFNKDLVDREKHAVNAEFQSGLKSDYRRQQDVLKTLANPAHPFSKFNVGNLDTLSGNNPGSIYQDLLDFYQRYYSADAMTLVVVGQEPVGQLRKLVEDKFSAVPDRNDKDKLPQSQATSSSPSLYPDTLLPARIDINPIKDQRRLLLQFPIPNPKALYRQKPVQYIANLIGHEGSGSLLSYLKNQGWAEHLAASQGFSGEGFATFAIDIGLTRAGLENIDQITRAVFEKIALIRQQGIEEWRYQEQSRLHQMAFVYQENSANIDLASTLSRRLHDYPVRDVLSAPYVMDNFDAQQILSYLDKLTPDNLLMLVVAKELKTDKKTKWYATPYALAGIGSTDQQRWLEPVSHSALVLPPVNPFIPDDLALLLPPDNAGIIPEQIINDPGVSLWYKFDNSFGTPRANFYFSIRTAEANQTPRQAVLTQLYVSMVNEELNEFSYPAYLANLNYQLYKHMRGVSIRLSGYQQKQPVLLTQILGTLTNPEIDAALFEQVKQRIMRQLANTYKSPPSRQASSKISELLVTPSWSVPEMETALSNITREDLVNFVPELFSSVEIVALANGNINKDSARDMANMISRIFRQSLTGGSVPPAKVARVTQPQQCFAFAVPHPDSAVAIYYQGADKTIKSRATFALLTKIVSVPFFHELRTEKQLGYIVYASPMTLLDVPGLVFIVQSPSHSSESLVENSRQFTDRFKEKLASMDKAEFEQHKRALITQLLTKDTRLVKTTNRFWREIDRENYAFNTRDQLVDEIRSISLDEFQHSYQQFLTGNSARQLSVLTKGQSALKPANKDKVSGTGCAGNNISDVKALQESGAYFPI